MGLDIKGKKTGHYIRASYSRLHHTVRYLALRYCGMPEYLDNLNEVSAMICYMYPDSIIRNANKINPEKLNHFFYSVQLSGKYFPNILLHSDCEGNYTKRGKCDPFNEPQLLKGNSLQLLKELEVIVTDKDLLESKEESIINALPYTIKFYELVKDEIENGTGTILFY